ncbi:MAG TPA: PAS domain S-box protein [Smithella sp.]|nr:PAS domain S-box protein [Smithella sp.]
MKIRTRLKLNTWLSLAAIILLIVFLGWAFREANLADQNVTLAQEIQKAALERIILRDDWILHREDRAKIQWYAKTESLRQLLESALPRFKSKKSRELLREAIQHFETTHVLFDAILDKHQREERDPNERFAYSETELRMLNQVLLKAYSLNDSISRLREHLLKEAETARDIMLVMIFFFIVGGISAIVINSMFLNRIVAKGVSTLTQGIRVIGHGNLDHKIAATGNDELADLARAVNETTAKLNQSYTSVRNLQTEISERKKVEEEIKKLSLHQQTLLDAIPDIIMEVDINKIYTWANGPGIKFFGKDVIGKTADFYFVREQDTYDRVQPIFNGSNDLIYLESWQKRQDGQERLLAWWCRAIKDVQGNVIGALSSARDITIIKQTEEEIKKLNEDLEQRVAQRTAELTAKTNELERINKVFVDRELRMRALKKRIAELDRNHETYSDRR